VHHFEFPHAAQVVQVTRKTHDLSTRRWRAVTLTHAQSGPARLADRPPPGTGRSRTACCTISASPPSPRTPPSCAPGPARRSWPACATSLSSCSAGPGRAGQPRRRPPPPRPRPQSPLAVLGVTPHSASPTDEPDITRERRALLCQETPLIITPLHRPCLLSGSRLRAAVAKRRPLGFQLPVGNRCQSRCSGHTSGAPGQRLHKLVDEVVVAVFSLRQ
jgi:hypothetical protein